MNNDFKSVIFDLDGTLIDSIYVWKKVDVDFFASHGMEIPENYVETINSMSFEEAAVFTKNKYNFKESVEDIIKQWHDAAVFEYSNNVKLKKGVWEYINYLKNNNIKIGLATASPVELYVPVLKNNKIFDYFDAFVSGSEVKRSKEFPDIYMLCSEKLKTNPEHCIVFEDIYKGIKGAKSAGMKAFGVYDKYSEHEEDKIKSMADGYIYSFEELI